MEQTAAIKTIKSQDNPKYKLWKKLLRKKYRDQEKLFLVEGELLIEDALKSSGTLHEIIVKEDYSEEFFSRNPNWNARTFILDSVLFDSLIQTENGRSVIGVFGIPRLSFDTGDVIVLDRLQDPGNIGTIIRTADAAGFSGVMAMKGTGDIFSPKVVRAAAGSIFRVPIIQVEDIHGFKEIIEKLNISPVAIVPGGDKEFYDMPERNLAIIVGNEGAGVCSELMDISEMNLRIPMRSGIESLNAAMAAGIVMYERVRRKCRKD